MPTVTPDLVLRPDPNTPWDDAEAARERRPLDPAAIPHTVQCRPIALVEGRDRSETPDTTPAASVTVPKQAGWPIPHHPAVRGKRRNDRDRDRMPQLARAVRLQIVLIYETSTFGRASWSIARSRMRIT